MQKYEEIRVLGEGSYGKAVLCRRKVDNILVVVKEIRISSLSSNDRNDSIHEASILSSLDHSFIVKYYESFQERGCFYIVMEYADGGDLAKFIESRRSNPLSEHEVLRIFCQLALAIKHIHDRKILHRDLKCQNIFMTKDGTVKLGDFGIARVMEHTFQLCKTQIGTPYYLSPEICEGRNYNSKTDIWSLGCILYELCTLHHAFTAQNMNSLFVNIIRGKYDPVPKRFSNDIQQLIARMLTYDTRSRPSINAVLATPIIKAHLGSYLEATNLLRVDTESHRMKRIDEIVKRRKESEQQRKQKLVIKQRKQIEEKVKDMERIMNLDTIGRIRYDAYRENRLLAAKYKSRANGAAWDAEEPCDDTTHDFSEDSFMHRNRVNEEIPNWARPASQVQFNISETIKRPESETPHRTLLHMSPREHEPKIIQPHITKRYDSSLTTSESSPIFTSSFTERRLQLQKQKEELEASRKAFMETVKEMEEMSSLVSTRPLSNTESLERIPKLPELKARAKSQLRELPSPRAGDIQGAKSRLSRIHELAESIRKALELPAEAETDTDDQFEVESPRPAAFYLNNKELNFPVVKDSDSLMYRAEAIRAFLERELGIEKLLEMHAELDGENGGANLSEICQKVQPGIVILMQQLIILDQVIANS